MINKLTLEEVAFRLGKSYDWLQERWRTLPGFPKPYIGGGPHQSPRWAEPVIDQFMLGGGVAEANEPAPAANTNVDEVLRDDIARFLTAAGI